MSSTLFIFFACLSAAISFGALFDKGTGGQLGAFETILSSALSGLVWSIFSGQPLAIMGATGPELAYTLVFLSMCNGLDLEFLPARVWQGLWCALFTILLAVFDGSAVCAYITRFTEDVFSALISFTYILAALTNIFNAFEGASEVAFFQFLLSFGAFGMSMYLRSFRSTPWLTKWFRNSFANFGATISLLVFSAIAGSVSGIAVETLSLPEKFEPTMKLSDGTVRPWLINPFGMERDFPVWGIFFTAFPALGLCILGFLDQNLTTLLINRKANALKKPPGYHLDLLVCGIFIYPLCSILGLPFTHAATIRSLTNLTSLTDYKEVTQQDDEKGTTTTVKVPEAVAEQRVSHLVIHVLIGLSTFLAPVLKLLPLSVCYGVFLYMGVTSMSGNPFFDRVSLWLIWDTRKYPAWPCIQGVALKKLHLYTIIQLICFAVLLVMTRFDEVAAFFPFFLVVISFMRPLLPHFFTKQELEVLDSSSVEDEDAASQKPEEVSNEADSKESKAGDEQIDVEVDENVAGA